MQARVAPAEQPELAAWAWPNRGHSGADKAAFLAREHVLELVSSALHRAGLQALLVKGAGLAPLYPVPWLRPMSDIDLLFRRRELEPAISALRSAGFSFERDPTRVRTDHVLEIAARPPPEAPQLLVELHLSLDKVVLRPFDVDGVFARSAPHETLPALRIPTVEDHVVLVILHLAADEFCHATGFVDLEVLLRAKANLQLVIQRAREARAATAAYVALSTLARLTPALVSSADLAPLRPGHTHERLLRMVFEIGAWPVAKRPTKLGSQWFLGQLLLSDESVRFVGKLARFGALRLVERSGAALGSWRRR